MKWRLSDLQQTLRRSPDEWPNVFVVFGDDAGQCSAHIDAVVKASGIAPDDPFAYEKIGLDSLLDSSGILAESAGTLSFGAARKLIRLTGVSGNLTKTQQAAVSDAILSILNIPLTGVLIVCPLPGLDAKSKLVRELEKAKNVGCLRIFPDSARDLPRVLNELASSHGKRLSRGAMQILLDNLGADRAITALEVEKVCLYVGEREEVTETDVLTVLAAAPSVNIFKLCDAVGNRDRAAVDTHLAELWNEGEDGNFVLLMLARHLERLAECQRMVASGQSVDAAMKSLKPPVFFGQREFAAQVNRYPAKRLQNLQQKLLEIQSQSRAGILSPEHVVGRAVLALGA